MTARNESFWFGNSDPDGGSSKHPIIIEGNQPSLAERLLTEEKQSKLEALSDALFVLSSAVSYATAGSS